ncbi:MAG: hypothetical protein QOH03_5117, partial [Kribbellaceae bacterium]|nr:hypothetical protein [Kribbellaceae bacterium]
REGGLADYVLSIGTTSPTKKPAHL